MPSMPATSAHVSGRIGLLANASQELTSQIDRLACITGIGTEAARSELAGIIHQGLKEGDGELESLSLQIATLNPTTESQAALLAKLHKLQESFKTARTNYRKSLLHSKRTSALTARKERELQFATLSSPPPSALQSPSDSTTSLSTTATAQVPTRRHAAHRQKKDETGDELLTSASSDVTLALRRTHALMSAELTRSQFAADTLVQSTETLKHLNSSYSTFDSVLSKSQGLVKDLLRKNRSDQWYYQMSLYALVGTIVWLIFRRLLWGPVYLLVWLPLRLVVWLILLPFNTGGQKGVAVDSGGRVKDAAGMLVSEVKDEVKSVVESMVPKQKVGGEAGGEVVKEKPKTIVLDNGDEVEVQLDPADTVERVPEAEAKQDDGEPEGAAHDEL